MYNASNLEKFIKSVHDKAAKAAQQVYDDHLQELNNRILAQLKKGDSTCVGMGMCSITNSKGENVGEKLEVVLTQLEYWDKCKAGFDTQDLKKI